MRWISYLEVNGTEIANANRTLVYVNRLLDSRWTAKRTGTDSSDPAHLACYCSVTSDVDYISPQADLAPWWDGSVPASGEFLGLDAFDIEVSSVAKRALTDRDFGAVVGSLHSAARIVAVTGHLYATTPRGMRFGEYWLSQQLAGSPACSDDTLTVLGSCDEDGFRDLLQVGIVDGPVTSQVGQIPECFQQQVFFQLAAGWPYLVGSTNTTTARTTLSTSICGTVNGMAGQSVGVKITIEAGSGAIGPLEVIGEPCGGYSDSYSSDYEGYPGPGPLIDYQIDALPAGSTLVINGIDHTVTLTDSGGRVIGGLDQLSPIGAFSWPEVDTSASVCFCVASYGTTNAGTKVTIEQATRQL